jgi:hypothetical protein
LRRGRKIEAIKLLREAWSVGLLEAKEAVEQTPPAAATFEESNESRSKHPWLVVATVVALVWAFVTSVDAVGSAIVLAHASGYTKATFVIEKIDYSDDPEVGLVWGFRGTLPQARERMYAPKMLDAKRLGLAGLRAKFPLGSELEVWYNPDVTDTLFQHRTLRVVPYVSDLAGSERRRIGRWAAFGLAPYVGLALLGITIRRRGAERVGAAPLTSGL